MEAQEIQPRLSVTFLLHYGLKFGCGNINRVLSRGEAPEVAKCSRRYFESVDIGGLSLYELAKRTVRASWRDAVFGQGSRMAFYHFLAIFPSLLIFLVLVLRL